MSDAAEKKSARLRDFEHSLPMELLKAREAAMARFRPMLRDHGLTDQLEVDRAVREHQHDVIQVRDLVELHLQFVTRLERDRRRWLRSHPIRRRQARFTSQVLLVESPDTRASAECSTTFRCLSWRLHRAR